MYVEFCYPLKNKHSSDMFEECYTHLKYKKIDVILDANTDITIIIKSTSKTNSSELLGCPNFPDNPIASNYIYLNKELHLSLIMNQMKLTKLFKIMNSI